VSGDALDLIRKSQEAMRALGSYHFSMISQAAAGAPIKADGDAEPPDKIRLVMDLGTQGSAEMIIIGNDSYLKQPGTEQFMLLSGLGNPFGGNQSLSNPQQLSSFAEFADSASIVGPEGLNGVNTTHVTFTYDASKAAEQAAKASGAPTPAAAVGKATGDMWIEQSTSYVRQMKITTTTQGPSASPVNSTVSVTVTYSAFNQPVNPPIAKPENVITLPGNQPGPTATPSPTP
jgi:hypothetical protein